jgi:hypothetical protein
MGIRIHRVCYATSAFPKNERTLAAAIRVAEFSADGLKSFSQNEGRLKDADPHIFDVGESMIVASGLHA